MAIGNLSDEVILNIFRYYLDASPQLWPRLVHICRRWRHIVFSSQQALHLRLFCTHGTAVVKTLDRWPALPMVVCYGGAPTLNPPAPEDEDDIMAALKHSERVSSISLTVTSSLLGKLSAVERPFLKLEDLVLHSADRVPLTLPSAFWWGERLRTLHLAGAAIPALPDLLFPSTGLVDLQLHNIPKDGYFSPEAFVNALSRTTQLRTLSLHFLSFATPNRKQLGLPPRVKGRIILPALTHLKYRGISKYLDSFVDGVDAPFLGDIDITFLWRPTTNSSRLCRFINRIEMQKSHCQAEIVSSEHSTSLSFTQPEAPSRLELQISCKSLARQLSYVAQICNSLSPFLPGVKHLRVTRSSSGQDNSDRYEWLKLICPFGGKAWVHLAGDHSTNTVLALYMRQGEAVLPTLHKHLIEEPEPRYALLQEAVVSLIHSQRLSNHIIGVEYVRTRINELRGAGITFVQC